MESVLTDERISKAQGVDMRCECASVPRKHNAYVAHDSR